MGDDGNIRSTKSLSGSTKDMPITYIRGTSVIKKNNFLDHITKSKDHEMAVRLLKEREHLKSSQSLLDSPVCSSQSTIHHHICN